MRVVIGDGDNLSGKLLQVILNESGHRQVELSRTADGVLDAVVGRETDVVLLEADLADIDGFELCKQLRTNRYNGPILFVTRRSDLDDKVRGFESGADDYILKPFEPVELLVRIQAVFRRYSASDAQPMGTVLRVGDTELSVGELSFRAEGRPPVRLTPTEMRLLECLMRNSHITITRDTLTERTWGYDFIGERSRVDVYIRRLREKIEVDPSNPRFLHTVRGVGYVFRPDHDAEPEPIGTRFETSHVGSIELSQ